MLSHPGEYGGMGWVNTVSPNSDYFAYSVSAAMRSVERVVSDIAPTDIPILLIGESGTGKELIALEIHRRSRRSNEAFLKCNCAGLTADGLPADFISPTHVAKLEMSAATGTIFLDEVGDLNPDMQARVLQLLAHNERARPGTRMGARLISATTRDVEEQMHRARFREELYYRLSGVCLRLPPLRDRIEDIPALLDFFHKKYASLFEKPQPRLSDATMALLREHSWPGNVRELENFARMSVALGDEQLALSDLLTGIPNKVARRTRNEVAARPQNMATGVIAGRSLKQASREASRKAEHEMILQTLEQTRWNRKKTARQLQISYKALLYKIKQLGLSGTNGPEEASSNPR